MKSTLDPSQFDLRLLPAVIAIIAISLGALAWGWHDAHTAATKPIPAAESWRPPQGSAAPAPGRPKNNDRH